jgi:outer membrane protein, multidrug efflux system
MKSRTMPSAILTAPLIAILGAIAGCAVGPTYTRPDLPHPDAWVAPRPHAGDAAQLKDWWAAWGDPVLVELIDNAQRENATVAIAAARIAASRASASAAGAGLWPSVATNASDSRSRVNQQGGTGGVSNGDSAGNNGNSQSKNRSASIDALWELDLFGSVRRNKEAAAARAEARSQDWHDARVSVAAEVATSYVNLRACETLLIGFERDAKSRAETARLTELKTNAGFTAPADAALTSASAAEAAGRLTQQRADCDVEIKALSLVTVIAEPVLRPKLATHTAVFPKAVGWTLEVPATALTQRPDVASAERELAAASADIGIAEADRYPRITLTGSIGYGVSSLGGSFGGGETRGQTWSYGPAISLPIFDAGRRAANVEAAKARYAEALASYKGRTLRAVREVEESLVRIVSADNRDSDAKTALKGYEAFLTAADAKVRAGAGNLVELEEARRAVVVSQGAVVNVERERLNAWVTLYKAIGGAWSGESRNDETVLANTTTLNPEANPAANKDSK